jgi:hypothetical protein
MRGITVYVPARLGSKFNQLWDELQAVYGEDVIVLEQPSDTDQLTYGYEHGTAADDEELREHIQRITGELPT